MSVRVLFDVTGTRTFAALAMRRYVLGPIVLAMLALIVMVFGVRSLAAEHASQLVVALGLLLFLFIILQDFIADKLESDAVRPLSDENAACLISFPVLAKLPRGATTSYQLLEAVLKTERSQFILAEMGIKRDRLLELVKPAIESEKIIPFLNEATLNMERFSIQRMDAGCILFTFMQREGLFEQLLNSLDLSLKDMEMIVRWENFHHQVWKKQKPWSPGGLVKTFGGMGRKFVTGFNDQLDSITEDISSNILYRGDRKVVIHLEKIRDALHILSRSAKHNMLVIGDDGSGKETLIDNIAYQMRKKESRDGFAYTRFLILQANDLLSGAHDADVLLNNALKRANKQGSFVLVIKNIGLFLQGGDAALKGVLAKFLEAKHINIIGVTDTRDYHRLMKHDGALDSQFEKIILEPTAKADTTSVLMEEYFGIEDREHVYVTYKALKAMVDLADRYVQRGAFPGKAIDLLHDTVTHAKETKDEYVTADDVTEMVSIRAHMDIAEADSNERDVLKNLEENIAKKIIGQKPAIAAVTNALKRARTDISNREKPIGTFLFLGPTGVGKTQTAKALADEYFGEQSNIIRMDMNEYSSPDSVSAIVGSTDPSKPSEGFLTKQVQDKPFSLVLLDEIEKADKSVLNLFLQVLDEGHLIDAQGMKTDFRNTIIIATSNAGAQFIVDFIRDNPEPNSDEFKKALLAELVDTGSYSPEFLNRFDDVILYHPLTREETVKVAEIMISSVIAELEEKKGIAIRIDEDAAAAIAEKGYSPEFGAREMRRAVTDTLETYVADILIEKKLRRGDVIEISKQDLSL